MRVAIYGGSFNPPHVAHQLAVAYVLATQPVDEVWAMPTGSHAFGKQLVPFHHRVAMTELAMQRFRGARVSALEGDLPQPSYTVDTLKALRERFPGIELSLVVGADVLPETPQWKAWPEIERLARVVVVGRAGYPAAGSVMLPEVSSTEIRRRLALGQSVEGLLDRRVLDYAVANRLYSEV
ncbi:MAG: nicotinate (nicotinamide) nucleotide adenylyltransferase [Myxococcota bacterium]